MKKLLNRKSILLSLIAVFFCIFIVQTISGNKTQIKVLKTKQEPDTLTITMNGGKAESDVITLENKDGTWFYGKYEADSALVSRLRSNITSIKILGTASRGSDDQVRYGLEENSVIKVEALAQGKVLRSLTIGKDNTNVSQSYVLIDGSSSVSIAAATLHSIYTLDPENIRTKKVYSCDSSEISRLSFTNAGGSFSMSRKPVAAAVDSKVWLLDSPEEKNIDSSKVDNFVRAISSMQVSAWLEDDAKAPDRKPDMTAEITDEQGSFTLSFFESSDSEEDTTVTCSRVPYVFTVKRYVSNRFNKTPEDFYSDEEEETSEQKGTQA